MRRGFGQGYWFFHHLQHHHVVIKTLRIGKQSVVQAEAQHKTALLTQPGGQWHKVCIARADDHCVNSPATHGLHHINGQRDVGRHFVGDQVAHWAHTVLPEHRIYGLQTFWAPISTSVRDSLGPRLQVCKDMVQRCSVVQVVSVYEYGHIFGHPRTPLAGRIHATFYPLTSRHGNASPERRGLSSASPNAKLSGGVHDSRRRVMVPVLRGRA